MNLCILVGRIVGNASVRGTDTKALSFVVETINEVNGGEKKDLVNCVIFNPDPDVLAQLTQKGNGLYVELEGRVSSSSLKTNGEKRYNSDVIVRKWSFTVVDLGKS